MSDKGFFGDLFDLNHDGNLDTFERTMDFVAFEEMTNNVNDSSSSEYDAADELELYGLDPDELEYMDEDERYEAIEDAGLDPDDFDF